MQTLELECPACGELLELDAGFAGGVCRCSACGTLMTVPHDAAHGERAEQLSRPDRPDDPSGMSGFEPVAEEEAPRRPSTHASRRSRTSSRRSSSRGSRRGKDKSRGKGRGKTGRRSAGERIEQGVYQTASGKTVNIDRTTSVPTAKSRRTGVRIATIAVFFSIVGLVVAAGTFAVIWMLQNPKGGPPPADPNAVVYNDDPTQFTYTKAANPFTLDQPNIVGLPLSGTVVLIIDTSAGSRAWIEPVTDMIAAGLSRPGSSAKLVLLRVGDDGVQSFRNDPVSLNTVTPSALSSFIKDQRGTGAGTIEEAIDRALPAEPDMLVLVTGQPSADEVAGWRVQLSAVPDVEVCGVLVNAYSPDMRELIGDRTGGRFITLTTSEILDWQDEAAGG